MSFRITFEEGSIGTLSPTQVENFSFVSSIFKLYSGAKFSVKDISKSLNNKLKKGMNVTVAFFNRNGDKELVNDMAVLSFSKSGSDQFVEFINITLISSIFFKDTNKTLTRTGNVGQIIKTTLSEDLGIESDRMDVESTDDRVRRRYQLSEKSQDFMKRILKYGTNSNTSLCLFTAPDGLVYLKSVYSMFTTQPQIVLTTMLADQIVEKSEGSDTLKERVMTSYVLNTVGKNAVSVMDNVFSVDNFRFSTDLDSHWESKSTESGNSQVAVETPPKTRFFNWNYTPDDAKAIAVKEFFEETIGAYSLFCTLNGWPLQDFIVGTPVYLILPYEPNVKSSTGAEINLGEGIYLITESKLVYENKEETMSLSFAQISS